MKDFSGGEGDLGPTGGPKEILDLKGDKKDILDLQVGRRRFWPYRWTEGGAISEWTLLLENGVWFFIGTDGIRHPMPYYSNVKYYYKLGRWCDLDAHQHSFQCTQWQCLATKLLPHLNSILESGEWGAKTVKHWSHHGCTRRYGDVGNRCMMLVIDMALELNRRVQGPCCWEVERRNMEHKALGFPKWSLFKMLCIQMVHCSRKNIFCFEKWDPRKVLLHNTLLWETQSGPFSKCVFLENGPFE
jgi:hypothetical protein